MFASENKQFLRRLGLLCWLLLPAFGCGGSKYQNAEVDHEEAAIVLQEALSAWQAGKPLDAFRQDDPPIMILDPDWGAGAKLVKFEIVDSGKKVDGVLVCDVRLTIENQAGSTSDQSVQYRVTTSPDLVVMREIRR